MGYNSHHWHNLAGDETVEILGSSPEGLSGDEAGQRLRLHGENIIPRWGGESPWLIFWRQLNNPIGWLLIGSGSLSVVIGRQTDAIVVFAAVAINSLLGFIQELRAGREIASLSALVPEYATVLRDGRQATILASHLVPGDLVTLQSGDKVPADLRLLRTKKLLAQESTLTGESLPVAKLMSPVEVEAPLGDRVCMAYSGTMILQGTGTGVVVATGGRTELGKISQLLRRTEQLETPLTRQLARVSRWITLAVILVVTVLVIFGILVKNAQLAEALMVAVSLAVAAIPEGLPAVITIALAIGVRRMAARRAVVRHLPAVETLGSTTVICTDKTGTLTRNEMVVMVAWADGLEYRFGGAGYDPEGVVEHDGAPLATLPQGLGRLLTIAVLCNDSELCRRGSGWSVSGDPMEGALLAAAARAGLGPEELRRNSPRLDVLPFESEHKFMATLTSVDGSPLLLLKGAPETVLQRCAMTGAELERIETIMETFARQGLRVIACASRPAIGEYSLEAGQMEAGFSFAGFLGLLDPPRTEAMDAIRSCHSAGIVVKMITGDHPVTADAIGRQLGLLMPGQRALVGRELDSMDLPGMQKAIMATNVIARVSPEHKLRIVEALQGLGEVVAMTGDGVNDAPALKKADIGVAMGITGTDVSREAAKVVLVDDNFASIAAAVEEGRRVYDNLIKSLAFILPTNLGLALTLSSAMFFFPTVSVEGATELLLAMSPSQTLWINLVASVTLSIPLAFEVPETGTMGVAPRAVDAPVFSGFLILRLLIVALLMAGGACALFLWEYFRFAGSGAVSMAVHQRALAEAQTVCVTSITFTQVFYLLNCRSLRRSIFSLGVLSNPAVFAGIALLILLQSCFIYLPTLQHLFGSAPLDFRGWLDALLVGAIVLPVIAVEKRLRG